MAANDRLVYSHSIGESFVHIINPVAVQALKAIIDRLGYLDYFGENGKEIHVFSDFSSTSKAVDENGNPAIVGNRIRAKLNPNVNPNSNKWEGSGTTVDLGNGNAIVSNVGGGTTTRRIPWQKDALTSRNFSLMHDSDCYVDLNEMAVGSTLSLEVQCEFLHSVVATEFLSRIFQCLQDGDLIGYVDVEYDYPVPGTIQSILRHLHDLKDPETATNAGALRWVLEKSKGNLTVMQNRNAPERKELVVNKNNFQALYIVECSQDFPTPANPEGAFVNFTLTVQYARANRLVLRYPPIINNEYVDFKYVPTPATFRVGTPSPIMWDNEAYTRYWQECYIKSGHMVYHYPWWDDWSLPTDSIIHARGFKPVAIVAFTLDDIDQEDGETVLDLVAGLPGFHLNDDIIKEIKYKRNIVLFPNDYVNVAVFADDAMVGNVAWEDGYKPWVSLDDGRHLIVRSRRTNCVYRLVISLNLNPLNMTSRPLSYQIYPSRWLDITKPTYTQTKDGICLEGVQYFYWDDENKIHVPIPADVAYKDRPTNELKEMYHVNVLFIQEPPLADTTMAPVYETINLADEEDIKIDEKRAGTPSGQVYCYRLPSAGEEAPRTYIDLDAICAQIRIKTPGIPKITLADVRQELALPNNVVIEEEIAPAIEEPIETISTKLASYIKSSQGINQNRVWKVGMFTGRPGFAKYSKPLRRN